METIRAGFAETDITPRSLPARIYFGSADKVNDPIHAKAAVFALGTTNGWLGYVPIKAAFQRRGGHESTLAWWSKMAPDTGDILAEQALRLIRAEYANTKKEEKQS